MDELMSLLGPEPLAALDPSAFDPAVFGLDAGVVLSINQATNVLKEDFMKWGWDKWLNRFYPALPFILGFGLSMLTKPSLMEAVYSAAKYGVWANFTWHLMRVSVKGQ
jgi:hypothetical protein